MWSKKDRQPFYAMTAHWIYQNKSGNLNIATRLIAFHRFWGQHNAKNMAEVTLRLLDRVGATAKVRHRVPYSNALFDHPGGLAIDRSFHSRQSGNQPGNDATFRAALKRA
jgi:hypothetical protein